MTTDPHPLPPHTPPGVVARHILANMPVTDPHGWLAAFAHACDAHAHQHQQQPARPTWDGDAYWVGGRDHERDYSRMRG